MTKNALAAATLLMTVFWASRMIGIQVFPPFIDEMAHIHFAEVSMKVSPLYYTNESRLFSIWYYALFSPWESSAAVLVGRTAALLMNVLSLAAAFAIARRAAGWAAGFLVAVFIMFSTYHIFFGRFMLADTVANTFTLLAIWFAFRRTSGYRVLDAVACGLCLFLAAGSKMTTLPYLFVPIAALTLQRLPWVECARWLMLSLGTALLLLFGFALTVSFFGYDPFSLIGMSSSRASTSPLNQIINSSIDSLSIAGIYWSTLVIILLLIASLLLLLKRQFYLVFILIAPVLVIWASPMQNTRYIVTPMTLLLICGASTLALVAQSAHTLVRRGVYLAAVLAFAVPGIPFGFNVLVNPLALPLPLRDEREYIASDGSGFGLRETMEILTQAGAVQVVGLLSNCDALRFTAPAHMSVVCPGLRPDRANVSELEQLLSTLEVPGAFAVVEDNDYVPAEIPGIQTAVVERPDGGPVLTIYRLHDG